MDEIVFNDPAQAEACAELTGTRFDPRLDIAICRVRRDVLVGGVIYTDYTGESIAMHTASWDEHWINRDLLFVGFDYPFNQLGVKRIFGRLSEGNMRALEFNMNAGFRTVARIEGVYKHGIAQIVMRLDRDDCRFLKIKPRGIRSNYH